MRGDDLAARARSIQRTAAPEATEQAARPRSGSGTPRTANIRLSIDLSPRAYRDLTSAAAELAERTGRARVTHVDIVRALIAELGDDPALFDAVAERLLA